MGSICLECILLIIVQVESMLTIHRLYRSQASASEGSFFFKFSSSLDTGEKLYPQPLALCYDPLYFLFSATSFKYLKVRMAPFILLVVMEWKVGRRTWEAGHVGQSPVRF